MLKRIIIISTIVSLCLLALILNVTTPSGIGPFGILVVFIFGYLSSLGVVTYFIFNISRLVSYLSTVVVARKPVGALTLKRSCYYSAVVAAAPIMLIGLQSVGAAGVSGVILVIIFVVVGCLYISKRIS